MNKKMKKAGAFLLAGALTVSLAAPAFTTTAEAAKIKLNKTTVYLLKGKTVKLKITGTKKKVTWKSSKKKVATVSKKGKVKAKKVGTATITAKVKGKKYKCKVIVETKKQRAVRVKKEAAAKQKAALKTAAAKAKALRAYILKNGEEGPQDEEEQYTDEYQISKTDVDDQNADVTVTISAYESNNQLNFSWQHMSDSPGDVRHIDFTINLTNAKVKVKSGSYTYKWTDGYDNAIYTMGWGKIRTDFNAKNQKGLTITNINVTELNDEDEPELNKYSTADDVKEYKPVIFGAAGDAFEAFDEYLLKDLGYSMESIGFADWK